MAVRLKLANKLNLTERGFPLSEEIKKGEDVMKKTYVNPLLEVTALTEDVVRMSGEQVYESDQNDFSYSELPWGLTL